MKPLHSGGGVAAWLGVEVVGGLRLSGISAAGAANFPVRRVVAG